jgi:pSer/pThr/pTyr-binding forkhead associated (FHA) protein
MNEVGPLRLECRGGKARGTEIVVDTDLIIGRHGRDVGNLAGDEQLSRHHARIQRTSGGDYVIHDLLSMNGTFVNGERIRGSRHLVDGDRIDVGTTTLIAHLPERADVATGSRPRLARVEIDLDARAVTVQLDDGLPLRLVESPEGWRTANESPS